ncbi:integral membrane sensor signal transduction histidine kinase [Alkaliphilus metalliredigens QYMF]|uniref:histidine kinase n=1 Tax=Alkaliphilus metalliredigens (strain QYMF) TaxID=293826 RepID=A6TU11_ALKMQ|nr:sensor histidine kinase [Alkaliphilus metalliredigens]ABR49679.1 integral membrane sensor signal transduction histidine kinase [Alkaliphilus metalliredigens QYMF]
MKLFIKHHISFIVLFILVFICLGFTIEVLGGIENNFKYFVFLSFFLLFIFLAIKYFRNYRIYNAFSNKPKELKEILLHNPKSALEEAFSQNQREYFKIFNNKILELESIQKQYKMFIDQSIHQMKTPLSVISMISQKNGEDESFKKVLAQVNNLDYHLSQTLKFLRLSDIEKDIQIEKINLRALVVEVINDLKDFFILNAIYPSVNIDEDIFVFTDKKQIKNVIYQITNNGIKYGRKDSKLIFDIKSDIGNTILNITNDGIGIVSSDIDRVFDIFYTGENGRTYGESSGVGLYIVKKVLDLLSHHISIKSIPNEKTTFSIYF